MPEPQIYVPEQAAERSGRPPQLEIKPEPGAFGLETAKAREEQAAAFGKAGTELFDRGLELQKLHNDTLKNDLAVKAGEEMGNARAKYSQAKGPDVEGAYNEYTQTMQNIRQRYAALAPNPYVQKSLDDELSTRIVRDQDFAGLHRATELNKYAVQTRKDTQKSIEQDAFQNNQNGQFSTAVIDGQVADAENNAAKSNTITNEHTGEEEYAGNLTASKIQASTRVVESAIDGALLSGANGAVVAHDLFEHYLASGKVDPSHANRIAAKIQTELKRQAVFEMADSVNRGYGPGVDPRTIEHAEAVSAPLRDVFKKAGQDHPDVEMGVPNLGGPAGIERMLKPHRAGNDWDVPGGSFNAANIAKLVAGESGFKNMPPNEYGYMGYFQLSAKETGVPWSRMKNMSFEEQLGLYVNYLKRNGYNGKQDLGLMSAAPAFKDAPDSTIAYRAGTKKASANPGWVEASNAGGNATVGGIKRYYARQAAHMDGNSMSVVAYKDGQPIPQSDPNYTEANAKVAQAISEAAHELNVDISWHPDEPNTLMLSKDFDVRGYQPAAPPTVEEKIKTAEAAIAERFPKFPDLKADIRRELHSRQVEHDQMARIQKYDDQQSVRNWVSSARNPDGTAVIDINTADPNVRAAFNRLNVDDRNKVKNWLIQNARNGMPLTPENTNEFRKLNEMANSEDEADRLKFLEIMGTSYVYDKQLTSPQINALNKDSKAVLRYQSQVEDDHIKQVMNDDFVKARMKQMGWNKEANPDKYLTVEGAIRELITAQGREEKKPLTKAERMEIANSAISMTTTVPSFFGLSTKEKSTLFLKPETEAQRALWNDIKQRLQQRGYPASDQEIQSIYGAMALSQQRKASLTAKGRLPIEAAPGQAAAAGAPMPPAASALPKEEPGILSRAISAITPENIHQVEQAREAAAGEMRGLAERERGVRAVTPPTSAYYQAQMKKIAKRRAELEAEETP